MPNTSSNAQRPVYFSKILIDDVTNPKRLDTVRARNGLEPTDEMLALWTDIKSTARLVVTLFPTDIARRKQFFEGLYIAAITGLVGRNFSLRIGRSNLNQVKDLMADEFPTVRSNFWYSYFYILLWLSGICLPIGCALLYGSIHGLWILPKPNDHGDFDLMVVIAIAALWIPVGTALGIFLEFIFSVEREMTYENLSSINSKRWRPMELFVNTVTTAWLFAFVMGISAIQVGMMSLLLNDFATTRPWLTLAVGFVTGLAFPYVRDIIFKLKPVVRETPATA